MVAAYRYRGHSFQILNLRPSIPHWIPGYPHVPPGVIVPKRSICVITDRRTMRLATTRQTKVPRSPWGRTTPPCTLHHSHLNLSPSALPYPPPSPASPFPQSAWYPYPKSRKNATSAISHPLLSAISLMRETVFLSTSDEPTAKKAAPWNSSPLPHVVSLGVRLGRSKGARIVPADENPNTGEALMRGRYFSSFFTFFLLFLPFY